MGLVTSLRDTVVGTVVASLALAFAPMSVPAQSLAQVAAAVNVAVPGPNAAYWTPARLAAAKPLPLPQVGALSVAAPLGVGPTGPAQSAPGRPPTLRVAPDYSNALFEPALRAPAESASEPLFADPTLHYRFTSARMMPDAAAAVGAESQYPFTINGQLFFKVPGNTAVPKGNYVCSATVQRRRLITTAGHCVSDGNGRLFKKFVFVPALRNGVGPLGTWTGTFVSVTDTWHHGGGAVPNAQDVAVIELADIDGHAIGEYTGYAGYQVPGLFDGQQITTNGYPCNIDNCNKIHRNDAQAIAATSNTAIVGSDMRGGASGGGWFINWGEYGTGQPSAAAAEAGPLRLVGVTSYGPTTSSVLYLGASILDSRYVNGSTGILDQACAHTPGNCPELDKPGASE